MTSKAHTGVDAEGPGSVEEQRQDLEAVLEKVFSQGVSYEELVRLLTSAQTHGGFEHRLRSRHEAAEAQGVELQRHLQGAQAQHKELHRLLGDATPKCLGIPKCKGFAVQAVSPVGKSGRRRRTPPGKERRVRVRHPVLTSHSDFVRKLAAYAGVEDAISRDITFTPLSFLELVGLIHSRGRVGYVATSTSGAGDGATAWM